MSDDIPPALRAPIVKTTLVVRREQWLWLKAQAQDAALRDGGQPSMNAVLERLIRAEMQKNPT